MPLGGHMYALWCLGASHACPQFGTPAWQKSSRGDGIRRKSTCYHFPVTAHADGICTIVDLCCRQLAGVTTVFLWSLQSHAEIPENTPDDVADFF